MNIRKKIAFFIHHIELINHWHNIFSYLDKNKYDVIIAEDSEPLLEYLKEEKINYISLDEILKKKIVYQYLISNHFVRKTSKRVCLIQKIAIYNIRYLYALGKSKWNFAKWNRFYDMILCMGPHQVSKLQFCKKTIKKEIGYSRYDNFFNNQPNKDSILKKLHCNINKKTIIWLPTWGEICSIPTFYKSISSLMKKYNVVVKPHPSSLQHEKEKIKLLDDCHFTCVIKKNFDNLFLYTIADFVICDYGGPPFGAIYTDKNLLLLNSDNKTLKNYQYLEPDSPDIEIRKYILNISAKDISLLSNLIENTSFWGEQKKIRSDLRKKYFSQNYGNSTETFAKILSSLDQYFPRSNWKLLKFKLKNILK
ncbi:MAG: hypothetical protein K940chlam1_01100 [Candidatus Anoxychlamydiales bacterium]|nr:hypothetical protein [Candidatus Anoxychlamydiales bacterium]NGX35213.1 hypothetical protein [Candidatus Anoxychlamydiales bacterium]